ncbi:AfsR/SARP family transcriptional regulator [Streptomyces flavalbus]|uniref:BTAD domain-containing putative transcriptional regulator n=1 Tax=Streptomyces flavalbus TaxID=2665155 RepID=A0ABW2WIG1_9ACTN
MRFRILGTVAVGTGGAYHTVPGRSQRGLLASLLIQAPAVVPASTLYDELWPRNPPVNVENALQAHVSRLRRTLVHATGDPAAGDALRTQGSGYRLDVAPDAVDLNRFREYVRRSRRALAGNDLPAARALLDRALALWQGAPLGDAAVGPLCRGAVAEWEEEHLAAREDALGLRVRAGEAMRAVGELKRMSLAHPGRERITELLMVALCQSGRQAEAVGVYHAARRRLAEELGREPSPKLRRLFRQLLSQDPVLHRSTVPLGRTA